MSAQPTERECLTVLKIAKLLDIELDPWQEHVLQWMLVGLREQSTVGAVRIEQGPPRCAEVYPGDDSIACARQSGHTGGHDAGQPGSGSYRHWFTTEACGNVEPVRRDVRCTKPRGHGGVHTGGSAAWD